MKLVPLTSVPNPNWLRLRKALWPDGSDAEYEEEMAEFVTAPDRYGQFMACSDDGRPIGLVEYVNGTKAGRSPKDAGRGPSLGSGSRLHRIGIRHTA